MKKLSATILFLVLILLSLFTPIISAAEEDGDIELFGFELEILLSLVNSLLATILFIVAFTAFRRDGRKRLLYVSIAFFLFALKGILVSSELFIPEIDLIDPIVMILESAIILSFFFGVLRK